jgi:hypothetical protein
MPWPSVGSDTLSGTNPAKERHLGNNIPPLTPLQNGDVNNDGAINSTDYALLKRLLLDL